MGILRNVLLWASNNKSLREAFPRYKFVRKAVSRFMPGETLEEALRAAEILKEKGIATVITQLGENLAEEAQAHQVKQHYLIALDSIQEKALDCHISVKPTHLGLDLNPQLTLTILKSLVEHASKRGNFVWIDMEGSAYTDATLQLFRQVRSEHSNVGICLQSYLYRTGEDLQNLLPLSPAIRLVKGAYSEPKDIAFQKKQDVDDNFYNLGRRLMTEALHNGTWPALGTHDIRLIRRLQEQAATMKLGKDICELQMLYGIGREDQVRLVQEGNRVRVLISYGSYWFPWYMRRLAERPANLWFILRNLFS